MKTRKFPLFYIVLISVVLIVVILTEIGKFSLKDVLSEYENSQYKYVAENVLQSYFTAGDSASCAKLFDRQISEFETEKNSEEYFAELTKDKDFSLQSISTGLDNNVQYAVKYDGKRFATLTLEKSGEKTKHGFDLYSLTSAELNSALLISDSVLVPKGYTLYVNGNIADNSYSDGEIISTESQKYMPDGTDGINYVKYKFDNLCAIPEYAVKSPDGRSCEITYNDNKEMYMAAVVYDEKLAEEYSEYAKEAAMAYAKYMQNDASFANVKKYFDPESELYTNIRTAQTVWVIDHNSYSFKDVTASEFYAYSDDVFSCRVTLTHVLTYRGLQDYNDYVDMTWYFRKVGDVYLIYNSFNNK